MGFDNNGDWVDEAYDPVMEQGGGGNSERVPEQPDYTLSDNSGGSNGDNGGGGKSQESMKSDLGNLYSEGAYDEWAHRDFDPGWYDRIVNKENLRADNEVGSEYHEDGSGGYLTKPVSSLLGSAGGGGRSSGASGGSGGSGGGGGGSNSVGKMDDVYKYLKDIFSNGGNFNQDIVNRRVDNVRGQLNTQRNSTMKNNEAYLADRGLIGSGPQAEAANSLDSRLFGLYGQSVNDINATESENADQRMLQSLMAATGLSEAEAQNAIEQFRANTGQFVAETDRTRMGNDYELGKGNLALGVGNLGARNREGAQSFLLGQGNLALGNLNAGNNYNLSAGQLQLDREKLQQMIESGDTDAALRYLELLQRGAATSANGQQS